eukprot:1886310-Karenia_brevis.AAC.1
MRRPRWDDDFWNQISMADINYDPSVANGNPMLWQGQSKTRLSTWSNLWFTLHYHYFSRRYTGPDGQVE